MDILYFLFGLFFLWLGAQSLITATTGISAKYQISGFLSSFFIIGLGTSSPEIFISILSSLDGQSIIAFGNVIGSNITNICLVFSLAILLLPNKQVFNDELKREVKILNSIRSSEILIFFTYLSFLSIVAFLFLLNDMSRINSFILILLFLVPIFILKEKDIFSSSTNDNQHSYLKILLTLIFGLVLLFFGADILLLGAKSLAEKIGIPDYVVGLSLTAIGTSLPELAAVAVSIREKHYEFIAGNIVGSNIFNIGLALGLAGVISPAILIKAELMRDFMMIIITTIAAYIFIMQGGKSLSKSISLVLLILFGFYQSGLYII